MKVKGALTLVQIAQVAHEAIALYTDISLSQIAPQKWALIPVPAREAMVGAVSHVLKHPDVTPEEMHARWVASMLSQGWIQSGVHDRSVKGHPNLRAFDDLMPHEQLKDHLYLGIVKVLLRPYIVAEEKASQTHESPPTPLDGEGSSHGSAEAPDGDGGKNTDTVRAPRPGPGGATASKE